MMLSDWVWPVQTLRAVVTTQRGSAVARLASPGSEASAQVLTSAITDCLRNLG